MLVVGVSHTIVTAVSHIVVRVSSCLLCQQETLIGLRICCLCCVMMHVMFLSPGN